MRLCLKQEQITKKTVSFEKCAEAFVALEAVAKLKCVHICISSASVLIDGCSKRICENLITP